MSNNGEIPYYRSQMGGERGVYDTSNPVWPRIRVVQLIGDFAAQIIVNDLIVREVHHATAEEAHAWGQKHIEDKIKELFA